MLLPLHRLIQRVLLIGSNFAEPPAAPAVTPPPALAPLIAALAAARDRFDALATHFGDRYRSGFWAIYLLSAVAVLCAVLPLAIGWDSAGHGTRIAGACALLEILIIAVVAAVYWLGHRADWQGRWLYTRTVAELVGYLPLIAPLIEFPQPVTEPNWYYRILEPGQTLREAGEISRVCARHEEQARGALAGAWHDAAFVRAYAAWVVGVLEGQQLYHRRLAGRQHALMHRVHRLTALLFLATAICALLHLLIHSVWLSLATTFFPALAAGLHGALAQSEAYRLENNSRTLADELQASIGSIRSLIAVHAEGTCPPMLQEAIRSAIALILAEHQDWHMLVRPHHLPLA
jgi:hypothetical protein